MMRYNINFLPLKNKKPQNNNKKTPKQTEQQKQQQQKKFYRNILDLNHQYQKHNPMYNKYLYL